MCLTCFTKLKTFNLVIDVLALTESALKDHARDLPVMNGIREDIKGIMSLRQGNFDHREALTALAGRVEAFEVSLSQTITTFIPLLQVSQVG